MINAVECTSMVRVQGEWTVYWDIETNRYKQDLEANYMRMILDSDLFQCCLREEIISQIKSSPTFPLLIANPTT